MLSVLSRPWSLGGAVVVIVAALSAPAFAADSAPTNDSSKVVATIDQHNITAGDLDQRVKPQVDRMRDQLEKRVEQILADQTLALKRQTLQKMADDYLIEQAAKKQGLSVDDFRKKTAADSSTVSDAEARKYYDDHKLQRLGTFDQVKPRIVAALNQTAMLERLRKDHSIKILLEPKRVAVNSSGHPSVGAADAPVTIVEFSDFQCPFCRAAEPTLKTLRANYGDKIRLVYMDYPLSFHSHAMDAARAARCANDQGKFWEFHDALFADQQKLAPDDLKTTAQRLGLDTAKFNACFGEPTGTAAVNQDESQGNQLGVHGTPGFFINGRFLSGAQKPEAFEEIIDDELANSDAKQRASK